MFHGDFPANDMVGLDDLFWCYMHSLRL